MKESNLHPDSSIVDALGGTTAVAELCGIKPPSVTNWRYEGIPHSWKMYFQMAYPQACGLERAPKPPKLRSMPRPGGRRVVPQAAAAA